MSSASCFSSSIFSWRKDERQEKMEEEKQEAEDIYQKFKEGETLDTEDLMKLQKTGLL